MRLLGVGAVGVVILLILIRMLAPQAYVWLFSPIYGVGSALHATGAYFKDRSELQATLAQVTAEKEALQQENLRIQEALEEYGELETDAGVVARVIARPPITPYDVLVVEAEGAVVDALVYAAGGVPVGVIADAGFGSARVALFSSSGRASEGWIGDERYAVSIIGEGAGGFSALVAREAPIKEADMVYVTQANAPIGVVAKIVSDASSPQALIHIRPFVNPFSITSVVIDAP